MPIGPGGVSYTLRIDTTAANRIALAEAVRRVTDTTRRVFNRAVVLTPVDTGRLRGGNQFRVHTSGMQARGEVYNLTAYSAPVHEGSRAHDIVPRTKKVLRFKINGKWVFARRVHIPARRGRPWLYRALLEVAAPQGYHVTRT